ncbi:hypothetical protein ACSDQ9_04775 [Aestuariimicrobium soli]|uniref:hypothetical protein n=1 Tax=Aestuariimicrobium soli TaxID=2035834 RepID=UPI003EBD9E5C
MTSPRPWLTIALGSAALGLASLLSNMITTAELEGRADTWLTIRTVLAQLVNSGTAWAGLLVWAGWIVGRWRPALLAGPLAGLVALTMHYGLAALTDAIPARIGDNLSWVAACLVLGPPLALVGVAAGRTDHPRLGPLAWAARLVVPVGAMAEPFVRGSFQDALSLTSASSPATAAALCASAISGAVLLLAGIIAVINLAARRDRTPVPSTRLHPHAGATLNR